MPNKLLIKSKISSFKKTIQVSGDKSISIRWVLLASIGIGKSRAFNILRSEDVVNAIKSMKKLGIKSILNKNYCEIYGQGLGGFHFKNGIVLNAGNSGTFARLILGLLVNSPKKIKLIGDKSLSRRDFSRIIEPLNEFGAEFFPKNRKTLPLSIQGTDFLRPINYFEKRGSAQCKSSVMLASLLSPGVTKIKAIKSRNHTELMFKNLGIPIKVYSDKKYDYIKTRAANFKGFNYNIPGDMSSCSFFIVLTLLSKNSKLLIKNVNINSSRIGLIKILNLMGAKIKFLNKKIYMGESIADIKVESCDKFKSIKCPKSMNQSAIDEFLIIFLVAAKSKGISKFDNLEELNQKESPRLKIASKILNLIGIRTVLTNKSIKIFGNPKLNFDKNSKFVIKNFFKDHRVFMMSVIAALSFGGTWCIHDKDSIKTSFPDFLSKVNYLKNEKNNKNSY